ncbi:hypothetical protein, partial [Thermoanaerobaculum aquaticum]|uniref:hypothetical protein n=1 Tax=Thermoanaerobaculum aquaticum TaxID=1312852 RepID=UPI00056E1C01
MGAAQLPQNLMAGSITHDSVHMRQEFVSKHRVFALIVAWHEASRAPLLDGAVNYLTKLSASFRVLAKKP